MTDDNWPFENITCDELVMSVLQGIWADLTDRRPFKHDFPAMKEDMPEEFDLMFQAWANMISGIGDDMMEDLLPYIGHKKSCDADKSRTGVKILCNCGINSVLKPLGYRIG